MLKIGMSTREVKIITYKCENCNTVFQMLQDENFECCPYCGAQK